MNEIKIDRQRIRRNKDKNKKEYAIWNSKNIYGDEKMKTINQYDKQELELFGIEQLKELENILYNYYILVSKVRGYKEIKWLLHKIA